MPGRQARPNASNVNFAAGQTVPNYVIVAVGADGGVNVYNFGGNVDLLIDLNGWFGASSTLGAPGPAGPVGPSGPAGQAGTAGPAGPQGNSGSQGGMGLTGPIGPPGANGNAGAQGPAGATGAAGPQGPKGDAGAIGATGPQGLNGDTGAIGPQGLPGLVGSLEQLASIPCTRNGTSGLTTVSLSPDAYARIRCVVPTALALSAQTVSCNLYLGSCEPATATVTNFAGNATVHLSYPPWGDNGLIESNGVPTDPSGSGSGGIPNMIGACAFTFNGSSATNTVVLRADDPTGLPSATAQLTVVCLRGQ